MRLGKHRQKCWAPLSLDCLRDCRVMDSKLPHFRAYPPPTTCPPCRYLERHEGDIGVYILPSPNRPSAVGNFEQGGRCSGPR